MTVKFSFDDPHSLYRSGQLTINGQILNLPNVILSPACLDLLTFNEIGHANMITAVDTFKLWQLRQPTAHHSQESTILPAISELTAEVGIVMTADPFQVAVNYAKPRGVKSDIVRFRTNEKAPLQSLTPEQAVAMQRSLGADLISMPQQVPDYFAPKDLIDAAAERTAAWGAQALGQVGSQLAIWGWQGAGLKRSRQAALDGLIKAADPQAIAISGLFQSEPVAESRRLLTEAVPMLRDSIPTALRVSSGNASFDQLVVARQAGVDLVMTDCPTELARSGQVLTADGPKPLSDFVNGPSPIDPECQCPACQAYSAKGIALMLALGQVNGQRLLALHNLTVLGQLVHHRALITDRFCLEH